MQSKLTYLHNAFPHYAETSEILYWKLQTNQIWLCSWREVGGPFICSLSLVYKVLLIDFQCSRSQTGVFLTRVCEGCRNDFAALVKDDNWVCEYPCCFTLYLVLRITVTKKRVVPSSRMSFRVMFDCHFGIYFFHDMYRRFLLFSLIVGILTNFQRFLSQAGLIKLSLRINNFTRSIAKVVRS